MNALIGAAMLAAHLTAVPHSVSISQADVGWDAVTITLGFEVSEGDQIALRFAETWGPAEDLTRLVSQVSVRGPHGPLVYSLEGGALEVSNLSAGRVEIRYNVAQDYEGEPQWGVQRMPGMRPVLQPDYAFFAGAAVLPSFGEPVGEVVIRLPDGGAFNRPLQTDGRSTVPYATLKNGMFALGAFRIDAGDSSGVLMRSALRGHWSLDDSSLRQVTRQTLSHAASLFDDAPFKQYFLLMTPLPPLPNGSSVIGSGFDEGFFLLATPNAETDNLVHTITHEVLHEWIPRRAGLTEESTDPSRAWFTEGFTEYFTQRVLLATGRISIEAFAAHIDALWTAYQASNVNTLPASELNERLFESEQTERLPYQRGALLALHWDTLLKARSGPGLSQVIARLIDRADGLESSGEPRTLTDEALHAALRDALGQQFDADFQRHIVSGERVDVRALRLPDCMEVNLQGHVQIKQESAALQACATFITRR